MACSLGSASTSYVGRPARLASPCVSHVRCRNVALTVCGKAKPTKAADFRGLTNEEIDKEVYECQRKLMDLRFAQKTRKVRSHFLSVALGGAHER